MTDHASHDISKFGQEAYLSCSLSICKMLQVVGYVHGTCQANHKKTCSSFKSMLTKLHICLWQLNHIWMAPGHLKPSCSIWGVEAQVEHAEHRLDNSKQDQIRLKILAKACLNKPQPPHIHHKLHLPQPGSQGAGTGQPLHKPLLGSS